MKALAHRSPYPLHRAFSLLLFANGKLLLQKRAKTKVTFPDLWTNTVCSHQREGETNEDAARRQIMTELGITLKKETEIRSVARLIYKAESGGGWGEHECK